MRYWPPTTEIATGVLMPWIVTVFDSICVTCAAPLTSVKSKMFGVISKVVALATFDSSLERCGSALSRAMTR